MAIIYKACDPDCYIEAAPINDSDILINIGMEDRSPELSVLLDSNQCDELIEYLQMIQSKNKTNG